ncbi:hypothetical protein E2C01_060680 [Portunus trituberculatus]|uniref:Secreted protein n=1 Tax=Portunus trituberculatus TaxID=210409 RepID=A0A5B7H1V1_PORTR|nr:hypothetical protein [Portunus trituberculatus]
MASRSSFFLMFLFLRNGLSHVTQYGGDAPCPRPLRSSGLNQATRNSVSSAICSSINCYQMKRVYAAACLPPLRQQFCA